MVIWPPRLGSYLLWSVLLLLLVSFSPSETAAAAFAPSGPARTIRTTLGLLAPYNSNNAHSEGNVYQILRGDSYASWNSRRSDPPTYPFFSRPRRNHWTHTHTAVKRNDNDSGKAAASDQKKSGFSPPTQINEGSPVGVAVVILGTLLASFFTDDFQLGGSVGESSSVWIIFAAASTAAGLERVFLRNNDDDANNS